MAGAVDFLEPVGGGGAAEVVEGGEGLGGHPWLGPSEEVGKVHIGGEVLPALVFECARAGDALVKQVGAQRAEGLAVVQLIGGVAIVDGQHASAVPQRDPRFEPDPVGVVDFDHLAIGVGDGECRRVR